MSRGNKARWLVIALVLVAALCSVAYADPPPRVARSPFVAAPTATAAIPSSPEGRRTAGAPPPALTESPLLAGFIENQGQIHGPVAFYRRTGRQTLSVGHPVLP